MLKNYLFKPFEFVQEKTLFLIGISVLVLTTIAQKFTFSRIISFLKMADYGENPQWWQVGLDAVITTLLLALVLFAFGRFINTKTRFIDILNTVLIARIPISLLVFTDINGYMSLKTHALLQVINNPEALTEQTENITAVTILGVLGLCFLILFAYYLYQGFKTATHFKKTIHIVVLILLVLITDGLSRFITTLY